jgi:Ca2+-binding RTX toxin-like protein
MPTTIVGGGNHDIDVYGNGTVIAGCGDDSITIHGNGLIAVGGGNDTLTLYGSGAIVEIGRGHDTINLGSGKDTIFESGRATVYGIGGDPFATIAGGELKVSHSGGVTIDSAITGNMTIMGSATPTEFVGRSGRSIFLGGSGNDTFVGGSGHDTMTGGTGSNVFEFLRSEAGGHHVITNFVSGQDQLYLEGHSLNFLEKHHDIHTSGGNTVITLDGGATTITLKGFTGLSSTDITQHKP